MSCSTPAGTSAQGADLASPQALASVASLDPAATPAANPATTPGIEMCPVMGHGEANAALASASAAPDGNEDTARKYQRNADWWPNRLDLSILRQNSEKSDPMGDRFDYAAEFAKVNLDELRADVKEVMTTSQDWWPADWGNYGGLFIRMA
ncbi:MAG: hypothetical protein AAGG01_02250, partial [Planctomycetota bacterium]